MKDENDEAKKLIEWSRKESAKLAGEISRKPNDILPLGSGLPVLRVSAGGNSGVGFYVVYRGDPNEIVELLETIREKIMTDLVNGVEHPIEPEDGRHR